MTFDYDRDKVLHDEMQRLHELLAAKDAELSACAAGPWQRGNMPPEDKTKCYIGWWGTEAHAFGWDDEEGIWCWYGGDSIETDPDFWAELRMPEVPRD
jgi:hypothetical protein